jgi:hypothetical protein
MGAIDIWLRVVSEDAATWSVCAADPEYTAVLPKDKCAIILVDVGTGLVAFRIPHDVWDRSGLYIRPFLPQPPPEMKPEG